VYRYELTPCYRFIAFLVHPLRCPGLYRRRIYVVTHLMEGIMSILSLLTYHTHYWGIPHERPSDKRLIQTCYESGAEREIKIDLCPLWVPSDPEFEEHKARAA
jgi:hypothetical protein